MATKFKKKFKKSYIFLNGRPFNRPFFNVPATKKRPFFAASLIKKIFKQKKVINIFIEGGGYVYTPIKGIFNNLYAFLAYYLKPTIKEAIYEYKVSFWWFEREERNAIHNSILN